MNGILIPREQAGRMIEAAISQATAPCPKCRRDMDLAVITPHPIAQQLARHTYLCRACNQTKTYVLPISPSADGEGARQNAVSGLATTAGEPDNRRSEPRETLNAPGTIYDKDGSFLAPCTVRDLSRSGGRVELFKESTLPQYFLLSLLPDGGGRRLCSKVWQLALVAGVRFVEKQTG